MAARAGQVEVVRCLLRNGALVDARARVGAGAGPLPHCPSQSRCCTQAPPCRYPGWGPPQDLHTGPKGSEQLVQAVGCPFSEALAFGEMCNSVSKKHSLHQHLNNVAL